MPGHPVGESLLEQTKDALVKLVDLISSHDVVFLLLDSREARWLPTLLGAYHKKVYFLCLISLFYLVLIVASNKRSFRLRFLLNHETRFSWR